MRKQSSLQTHGLNMKKISNFDLKFYDTARLCFWCISLVLINNNNCREAQRMHIFFKYRMVKHLLQITDKTFKQNYKNS